MKLLCALILWHVLLQVSKEDIVPAEHNQVNREKERQREICQLICSGISNDLQSEDIESKNNQIQILKEEVIALKRELESKNDQLKDSKEIETELRRELESKYDPVGKCSMPTVRGELSRQQKIMEKLEKNLSEKQNDKFHQLNEKIVSMSENLENCEKKLKRQKNTLQSQKSTIDQLEGGVKEFVSQLPEQIPKNCIESLSSGAQYIVLSTGYILKVFCNSDIAGPGWTVIQQRIDGKVDFYRDWDTYRDGFGDFWNGSFFLGLEKIHRLTAEEPHELYIHMERFDGSSFYARYDEFAIAGEDDQYRLINLGAFSGSTEDDVMKWNENMKFSTYDRDNDASDGNCAEDHHGAWWYNYCAFTNLNGRYYPTEVEDEDTIFWEDFRSMKQVKMMIRPKVTSK